MLFCFWDQNIFMLILISLVLHLNDVHNYGRRIVPGKKNILSGGRNLLSGGRHLIYLAVAT